MKRRVSLLTVCLLLWLSLAWAVSAEGEFEPIDTTIRKIGQSGTIELELKASEVLAQGLEYGDVVRATIDGTTFDAPVCSNYSDVDSGCYLVRIEINDATGDDNFQLAINYRDLTTELGIAKKVETDDATGYRWEYREDLEQPVAVHIELLEKGAYATEYMVRHLERSNDHADYPGLSDAEYANFRAVGTTGMGRGALYRSSSPVDPEFGRNREACAALESNGVRTVINLCDSEQEMRAFEAYEGSAYAKCDTIALNLGIDFASDEVKMSVAKAMRFIIDHEGPYLIHCLEGKDRTGFIALLCEALMGARTDEIEADYMATYVNMYHVVPDSEQYDVILDTNLKGFLGIVQDMAEDSDLATCAAAYLADCGLTADEIDLLKTALGRDY